MIHGPGAVPQIQHGRQTTGNVGLGALHGGVKVIALCQIGGKDVYKRQGPESTGVTMHSVPGWVGDDHCITAEIEGVKAVVDICSSTSAIAGWSAVSLLRNLASPVCFY